MAADDVTTPDGVAIDWVHNLVFWTDYGEHTITVMSLDADEEGRFNRKVIVDELLPKPRAIAVDPRVGMIFWSDWGTRAKIESAGMDGLGRRVCLPHRGLL